MNMFFYHSKILISCQSFKYLYIFYTAYIILYNLIVIHFWSSFNTAVETKGILDQTVLVAGNFCANDIQIIPVIMLKEFPCVTNSVMYDFKQQHTYCTSFSYISAIVMNYDMFLALRDSTNRVWKSLYNIDNLFIYIYMSVFICHFTVSLV